MDCTAFKDNSEKAADLLPSGPEMSSEQKQAASPDLPKTAESSDTHALPQTDCHVITDCTASKDKAAKKDSVKTDGAPTLQTDIGKPHGDSAPDAGPLPVTTDTPPAKNEAVKAEERHKLARQRREERAKHMEERSQQQAAKRAHWLEKEEKARRLRDQQLGDRRRKLEEQRLLAERRRAILEEKQREKLEKNKARYEAAVKRSVKKTWAEIRQQRGSWAGGLNQNSRRESRCSASMVNLTKQVDSVISKRLSKSSATLWNSPCQTRRRQLSPWEASIVERLMRPTLSFLARSRSATTLMSSTLGAHSPAGFNSPLSTCGEQRSQRFQVSASTPNIAPRKQDSMERRRKEKKDKERENEKEKNALSKQSLKMRQSMPSLKPRVQPSPTSPRTISKPSGSETPAGSKTHPRRAKTPARVPPRAASPVTGGKMRVSRQPVATEKKGSAGVPAIVVSAALATPLSKSTPVIASTQKQPSPGPKPHSMVKLMAVADTKKAPPTTIQMKALSQSTPIITPTPKQTPPTINPATPLSLSRPVQTPSPKQASAESTPPHTSAAPGRFSAGTTDPEEAARSLAEKRRQAREQRERRDQERGRPECRVPAVKKAQEGDTQKRGEALSVETPAMEQTQQQRREDAAAEERRLVRERHFQKEGQERLERKKRLDEIMKRTRKPDSGEKTEDSLAALADCADMQVIQDSGTVLAGHQKDPTGVKDPAMGQSLESLQYSPANRGSAAVMNGIQTAKQNGIAVTAVASELEEIVHLSNHNNANSRGPDRSETDIHSEPILVFKGGSPFLMRASTMQPQHVTEVL
ncbi:MAP7 domain-containing protein 1-like isoform X2 [Brienomyrus brachyistius]|uniref:MAP7 domain-containing protein 1-like isoform X2 n=1 Tax=Brienomyrus brachyistius TaxID=42636 RepID=UPI0020B31E1F|nr:MAP7 domain-containing protein 1-like isoform X2 [Brienomyrus brachyistius]